MKFQDLLLSPAINKLGLWIGEHTAHRTGYWIARQLSKLIVSRKNSKQVLAVRINQWVVSGKKLNGIDLDKAVAKVYQSSSRSLYDYYHNLRNPDEILKRIHFDDGFEYLIARSKEGKKGLLGLLLHMGAYDLAGFAIALRGMDPQILSYPNPNAGYQYHNQLRIDRGLNVTPLSMTALHQASQFLKSGGTVITGVDRPWQNDNHNPRFFGETSNIPVTTIQLALRTKVPVSVIACIRQKEGHYILHGTEPISMDPKADREEELIYNTEKVLSLAEPFIRQWPEQWAMFYPVWPQFLQENP